MSTLAGDLRAALLQRRPLSGTRIIDAHAHAGPYSLFFIPRSGSDEMVAVMDRCGIRTALISSHLAIQLSARDGNDETARIVAAHPSRMLGYAVVNPWQDPADEIARWADDPRFVGIKVHPDLHRYPLTGPRYDAVWEFAETTGRPVLTHTWSGSAFDDLSHVAAVAERHPSAPILAGHAGVLRDGIDVAIEVARRCPNVLLELCGSHGHGEIVERMVGELGAGQVVFGSDIPFMDLRSGLGRIVFAGLTDDDLEQILGGTMITLLPALQQD